METIEEPGVIDINEDNAYIVQDKDKDKYSIYIDGKYYASINSIPEDLQNISIYKRGESRYEK